MAETKTKNLYQRLLDITEDVGKIEKTGKNTQQGYAFTEHSEVVAQIRVAMKKHGVMIMPETVERHMERYTRMVPGYKPTDPPKEQATYQALVTSRYTVINADDPQDRFACEWNAGEALDTSDKATNKATTASEKYFLMRLFKISDKDDPDGGHVDAPTDFAKAAPEEPSRQVTDDPISGESKRKVWLNYKKKYPTGKEDDFALFCDFVINKAAPTTEQDAQKLLLALAE